MESGFEQVIRWLREERSYQTAKFDYEIESDKPVEYWLQQFSSYTQRLPIFGLEIQPGVQAALKLAATAVALCEHLADCGVLPKPGVSSGEIQQWEE